MANSLSIKDTVNERKIFASRAIILSLAMLLLFLVLIYRFFSLQILDHDMYQTKSENNRIQIQSIPPPRGLITDRKGELLAGNITIYNLAIIVERIGSIENLFVKLKKYIDLDETDVINFSKRVKEKRRPFEPVPLKFRLTEKEIAVLAVNRYHLKGIEITTELIRFYPYGPLFAHSVGSVRRITREDLNLFDPKNYSGTKYIGKIGVEKEYESNLHGTIGIQRVETDAHGRVRKVIDRKPSVYGANLKLYLDVDLQAAAVRALGKHKGSVVAIDPRNGGILAMVSKPSYDPNDFVTGMSPGQFNKLVSESDSPLFNRAINGQYAPGSTFKPIVGLAGIANKEISWDETLEDRGEFSLPNQDRIYRDWSWTPGNSGGQGIVDLRRAIYRSSNVYFYTLAHRLEISKLAKFAYQFGIGSNYSIDIPDVSLGLLPDQEWKKTVKNLPWYPGDTVNMGIGQGDILVTPLQMAVVASIFANRGRIVKPKMVELNAQPSRNDQETGGARVEGVEDDDWELMVSAMEDVVHHGNQGFRGNGTAWAYIGRDIPYRMAGKSGTAQVVEIKQGEEYSPEELLESQKNHAWFIAFAPVEDPVIALSVLMENGGGGSSVAGPAAREIIDTFMKIKKSESS
ncbi:penicillin-binding protein 2 [Gammaproteobacteria bacterium]|nr:penicillin-binding protein 2 [Gammaproteobacteria bacterium]